MSSSGKWTDFLGGAGVGMVSAARELRALWERARRASRRAAVRMARSWIWGREKTPRIATYSGRLGCVSTCLYIYMGQGGGGMGHVRFVSETVFFEDFGAD